jgi:hypothetical protein
LILQDDNQPFVDELLAALRRAAPHLPVAVQRAADGAPSEDVRAAGVVILPASLAMQPGEALRLWLEDFKGSRLVLPQPAEGWVWLGAVPRTERDLAREAAMAVRQLAEGQEVRSGQPNNPWIIAGYVLGGIFGLMLVFLLLGLVISSLE